MYTESPTLFVIDDVLTREACDIIIEEVEEDGFAPAPITTAMGPRMAPSVRNNTRVMRDEPERAESVWDRVREQIPGEFGLWRAVGLNERWRFYRYTPSQRFRWHKDGSYIRSEDERSLLSFILYLNDGFRGGETRFEYNSTVITPRAGSALVFEHRLLHEGSVVGAGTKYVMRSDVMYRMS